MHLDMNGIITVWAITWRTVWPVMALAVVAPIFALLARRRITLAPLPAFALPVLAPIAVIVWSGAFWAAEGHVSDGHWRGNGLTALVVAGLVLVVGVAVRYRRATRYWMVLTTAILNSVFILAAGFVGSMAISDSWL